MEYTIFITAELRTKNADAEITQIAFNWGCTDSLGWIVDQSLSLFEYASRQVTLCHLYGTLEIARFQTSLNFSCLLFFFTVLPLACWSAGSLHQSSIRLLVPQKSIGCSHGVVANATCKPRKLLSIIAGARNMAHPLANVYADP